MLKNSKSIEETNAILKENNVPSYDDSFTVTFRISKKKFFIVRFGETKSHSQQPYFATSGGILNHTRSDWATCGQAQCNVLPKNTKAFKFYEKWHKLHCSKLTKEQYKELYNDLQELKTTYKYIESDRFSEIVSFDRLMSK